MERSKIDKVYDILDRIEVTENNKSEIEQIKKLIKEEKLVEALEKLKELNDNMNLTEEEKEIKEVKEIEQKKEEEEKEEEYPAELQDPELEQQYIGLLLLNPKYMLKYYIVAEDFMMEDEKLIDVYKSILFKEGQEYAPERAKKDFKFADNPNEQLKLDLKKLVEDENLSMEKVFVALTKLFAIRKSYRSMPIKETQSKIADIVNYKLYSNMSLEEVKSAINQVTVTGKFKQAILNEDLTSFLKANDNNLTNGLEMPFPILDSVFKGMRKGETMAFAMPSNAGKSRFTINLATYISLVHNKKVLVISNEMSEEKMKLCLITTILNNPRIQELHGQKLHKTEGEILEFKFRPDEDIKANLDDDGFILQDENETREDFLKRLEKISMEYRQTLIATDWVKEQVKNSIYFINITDHTNDELQKVIMNYYYKEKIEYVFYDTLKTDTEHIGSESEIKKTATILSNLAQNFEIFIYATLQLAESSTLPINLTINDLAVSRTVKEVLDTLCLIKQINRDNLKQYEYSLNEVDTKYFDLKEYKDPDVRYYACVVDKNRAGAKPTLLFKLNLAYNSWEELGFLRLKQR